METATRYLQTIESLMVENSRLLKELQDATNGKLPSRIIPQEEADQCFGRIAEIMGPIARGNLLSEVTTLCNEFKKIGQEYMTAATKAKALEKERGAIEKVIKGEDVEESQSPFGREYSMEMVNKVARLRAVLEVIKTRLDRLCLRNDSPDLMELRKDVAGFLSGDKNG
jgi:hypothetical protein